MEAADICILFSFAPFCPFFPRCVGLFSAAAVIGGRVSEFILMFFNDGFCCRRFESALAADFCDFPKRRKQNWVLRLLHIRPARDCSSSLSLFQGAEVPSEGRGVGSDP